MYPVLADTHGDCRAGKGPHRLYQLSAELDTLDMLQFYLDSGYQTFILLTKIESIQ